MAKVSTSILNPFWQSLMLALLRIPARLALQLCKARWKDLDALLRVALYREAMHQGLTQERTAELLDVTERTIRNFQKLDRQMAEQAQKQSAADRVLRRIEHGFAKGVELENIIGLDRDSCDPAWLLSWLVERKLIKKSRQNSDTGYVPGPQFSLRSTSRIDQHITPEEHSLKLAFPIIRILNTGPQSLTELEKAPILKGNSSLALVNALTELAQRGIIHQRLTNNNQRHYVLADKHTCLIPNERAQRLRSGISEFAEKLSWSLESLLSGLEPGLSSQRTLLFSAEPNQIKAFHQEHSQWVKKRIIEIDNLARPQHSKRFLMLWCSTPTPADVIG